MIGYLIIASPFKSFIDNVMNIYNESILALSYLLTIILNTHNIPEAIARIIGWCLVGLILLSLMAIWGTLLPDMFLAVKNLGKKLVQKLCKKREKIARKMSSHKKGTGSGLNLLNFYRHYYYYLDSKLPIIKIIQARDSDNNILNEENKSEKQISNEETCINNKEIGDKNKVTKCGNAINGQIANNIDNTEGSIITNNGNQSSLNNKEMPHNAINEDEVETISVAQLAQQKDNGRQNLNCPAIEAMTMRHEIVAKEKRWKKPRRKTAILPVGQKIKGKS